MRPQIMVPPIYPLPKYSGKSKKVGLKMIKAALGRPLSFIKYKGEPYFININVLCYWVIKKISDGL